MGYRTSSRQSVANLTAVLGSTVGSSPVAIPSTAPVIYSIYVTDSSYNNLDDTAVDPAGGYIKLIGANFVSGCTLYIGGSAVATTFVSATEVRAPVPAKTVGTYSVILFNTVASGCIYGSGLVYSGFPSFTSTSYTNNGGTVNAQLLATGDTPLVFSLQAGSTLPAGITLNGSGLISGTTTFNSTTVVTVLLDDAQKQTVQQTITLVIVIGDPYFYNNTLLLNGETATKPFNSDASTNASEISILGDTRPNNFNPYSAGYYSNLFSGTTDNIYAASNNALTIGTSNFTIEFWANWTAWTGEQRLILMGQSGSSAIEIGRSAAGGNNLNIFTNTSQKITASFTPIVGTWYHIALVRTGTGSNQLILYINGVSAATGTSADSISTNNFFIGGLNWATGYNMQGYISNVRFVNGTAVYTTAFTPPVAPLTAIANTALLACQSSRFVDTGVNALVITVNGTPTVQSANPFLPNASYSALGSTYFDGTGDYMTSPYNVGTDLPASTPMCFEGWVYTTSTNIFVMACRNWGYGGSGPTWAFSLGGGNNPQWSFAGTGSATYVMAGSAINGTLGQWNHYAFTRDASNVVRIFVNGVVGVSRTDSQGMTSGSGAVYMGVSTNLASGYATGYMADMRLVVGSAIYTTNFTPPAAPLTAVAGTSLLTVQSNQAVNNSQFLDVSNTSALITRAGNTNSGTFAPFGASWSNYFDGTTDYLSASTTATNFGTGAFTIETWWRSTGTQSNYATIIGQGFTGSPSNGAFCLKVQSTSSVLNFSYYNGSISDNATSVNVNDGNWHHIAVSRNGTSLVLYVDGVSALSITLPGSFSMGSTGAVTYIGYNPRDNSYISGYISNLKVVNGTQVYTANFTPSTTPLTATAATSLLTCQSSSLVDNSVNAFALTLGGTPRVQRFSPFASYVQTPTTYSTKFNGSSDYLTAPSSSTAWTFGTGAFTVEFWMYPTALSLSSGILISNWVAASGSYATGQWEITCNNSASGQLSFNWATGASTTSQITSGASLPTLNGWNHVAVVRDSSTITIYLNGVSVGSGTMGTSLGATGTLAIGYQQVNTAQYYTGYLSNVRVVNGTALYTANFTPSTTPLTAITNTSLLTLQDSTIKDNSTNAFTLTATGSPIPYKFNPFGFTVGAGQLSYTPAVYGGSAYFDGLDDYLLTASSSQFSLSGDFTIECWIYRPIITNGQGIFGIGTTDPDSNVVRIGTGTLQFWLGGSNSGASGTGTKTGQVNCSTTILSHTWYHIALVRSGSATNNVKLYLNGVLDGQGTGTYQIPTNAFVIGRSYPGSAIEYFLGYISNLRVVKGTAVYTSNFVPPTAPVTAIANTTFLLGANPAIADYTMQNNLETIGDAKLSTAIKKFNTASIYFDGTGDYLSIRSTTSFALAGDFTFECWVYLTAYPASAAGAYLIDFRSGSTTNFTFGLLGNGTNANTYTYQNATTFTGPTALALNTWYHYATVRSGTTVTTYLNGASQGSMTTSFAQAATPAIIGARYTGATEFFTGYIDDLRVSKYARYTANFTVPTALLTQ